jgi:hypothetical protein
MKIKNANYQILWDIAKAVSAYIKTTEKSQINDLKLHFKHLDKSKQAKPKISRMREIIKIRNEINELENKKL